MSVGSATVGTFVLPLAEGGARLSVAVHADPRAVETVWRTLEAEAAPTTFQRYDWIAAWIETVSPALVQTPLIVVGSIDGRPAFLWPFGVRRAGVVRVAEWLGGSHLGYHGGLHTREAVEALDPATTRALLTDIARRHGIDFFHLTNQIAETDGRRDPVVAAGRMARAVNDGFEVTLTPSFEAVLDRHSGKRKRKNARRKERMLAEAGDYRIAVLSPAEAVALLPELLTQKSRRLAVQGLRDVFADPGIARFYETVAAGTTPGDAATMEIWALWAGGKPQAFSAVSLFRRRATGVLLAFSESDLARASPGEILIHRQIEGFAARGFTHYDFGIGQERYKTSWADRTIPLWDTFLPVTLAGRICVAKRRLRAALFGAIRRNATLWARVRAFRKLRAKPTQDDDEQD